MADVQLDTSPRLLREPFEWANGEVTNPMNQKDATLSRPLDLSTNL